MQRPRAEKAATGHSFQKAYNAAYDPRMRELLFLKALFKQLDKDGSGEMDKQEFQVAMADPTAWAIMSSRFGLQRHEIPRVWNALDRDASGSVNMAEWLETCSWLMEVMNDGEVVTDWSVRKVAKDARNARSSGVVALEGGSRGGSKGPTSQAAAAAAKAMLTPRSNPQTLPVPSREGRRLGGNDARSKLITRKEASRGASEASPRADSFLLEGMDSATDSLAAGSPMGTARS